MKLVISLVYYIFCQLKHKISNLLGRPHKPRLTILYYHAVRPDQRRSFARQMAVLEARARVVTARFRGDMQPHRKNVAITFDDAFVSIAENALPELAARSFHCTVFVTAGVLGRRPSWLMESYSADKNEIVMAPEHLMKLPCDLIELGAHTMTHPNLTLLDHSQARIEIETSRSELEKLTGRSIGLFSFPYGEYNERLVQLCREARYEHIFTIVPEEVDTSSPNLLRGRTRVDPSDGPLEFFLKFNGGYAWTAFLPAMRRALAGS